jgi:hypothetical protein
MKGFLPWGGLASVGAVMLFATTAPLLADRLDRLNQATLGCLKQSDSQAMAAQPKDPPGDAEAVAAISQGRCVRLGPKLVKVNLRDNGYACIRWIDKTCLWIPEELLSRTNVDDGVF